MFFLFVPIISYQMGLGATAKPGGRQGEVGMIIMVTPVRFFQLPTGRNGHSAVYLVETRETESLKETAWILLETDRG